MLHQWSFIMTHYTGWNDRMSRLMLFDRFWAYPTPCVFLIRLLSGWYLVVWPWHKASVPLSQWSTTVSRHIWIIEIVADVGRDLKPADIFWPGVQQLWPAFPLCITHHYLSSYFCPDELSLKVYTFCLDVKCFFSHMSWLYDVIIIFMRFAGHFIFMKHFYKQEPKKM